MLGSKAKLAVVAGGFIVCIVALPWVDYAISSTVFKTKIRHVIAHRGNGFGEPENSIAAVIKARDNGYASEIDVRMSKHSTAQRAAQGRFTKKVMLSWMCATSQHSMPF